MNDPHCVPLDGEIRGGRHLLTVRVYYEDTDFTGVVYHASYLRFLERGRTNYLRVLGAGHRALFEETAAAPLPSPASGGGSGWGGFAFVVRAMQIDFLKPARMDDVIEIVTAPKEVRGASVMLQQLIARDNVTLVEAAVRVAFVSGDRPRPIPKPLRIAMRADHDRSSAPAAAGEGK